MDGCILSASYNSSIRPYEKSHPVLRFSLKNSLCEYKLVSMVAHTRIKLHMRRHELGAVEYVQVLGRI